MNTISTYLFNSKVNEIAQEVYVVAFEDESLLEINALCASELGYMTIGDAHELIAQSFGNYYYGINKSSIAHKIVKFFMKELN